MSLSGRLARRDRLQEESRRLRGVIVADLRAGCVRWRSFAAGVRLWRWLTRIGRRLR